MTAQGSPSSIATPPNRWRRLHPAGRVTDLGRPLLGLSVVALGVLFLLGSAGVLDAGRAIDRWWPLVIVAAGIFTLAERPPALLRGIVLTAIGGVLLLFTTDAVDQDAWDNVWPAAIIAAGLAILARWSGRTIPMPSTGGEDDIVRSTAIFSGPQLVSGSQRFRGAWLTAVFGGDARPARRRPRTRGRVDQCDRRLRRHRDPRSQGLAHQRPQHTDLRRRRGRDRPHGLAAGRCADAAHRRRHGLRRRRRQAREVTTKGTVE